MRKDGKGSAHERFRLDPLDFVAMCIVPLQAREKWIWNNKKSQLSAKSSKQSLNDDVAHPSSLLSYEEPLNESRKAYKPWFVFLRLLLFVYSTYWCDAEKEFKGLFHTKTLWELS